MSAKHLFLRYPNWKDKALTLSYDDGVRHDVRLIEIMQRHGLKGTFNINSGIFGEKEGDWRLTKAQALELYNQEGLEVAVHGVEHLLLEGYSSEQITSEIINDRKALENMYGKIIKGMAYAYGSCNDEIVQILKMCGISYARTTVSTEKFEIPDDWLRLSATCHHNNPKLMELAKKFIEEPVSAKWWGRRPKLFYLWGHSYEFDTYDNWNVIEEFASYMGGREDVWYATNGEIYEYVKAYNSLQYSADGTLVHNPTCTDVYLEKQEKQYVIAAGQTLQIV